METKEWKELQIENREQGPGPIHSTAMCLVAYQERDVLSLHELSEIKWDLVTQEI